MTTIEKMIQWMVERQGKVSYSMIERTGPNSYDCSSAVYFSLIAGEFLPVGTMGNTDTLFSHLEKAGWELVKPDSTGNYPAKKGDIFIWGDRGFSGGANGHTGIFVDDKDSIIHCNYGYNGITVNNHDQIWSVNGCPSITIYRYSHSNSTQPIPSSPKPDPTPEKKEVKLLSKSGTFYPDRKLAVSQDTNPDDAVSPALAYYFPGMAIYYDKYTHSNGYVWISYLDYGGKRRYIAVGPDDGRIDTTWGKGFLIKMKRGQSTKFK
ncbi:peptidoglycan amidohydrolase family protein [Enterococcus termitis]